MKDQGTLTVVVLNEDSQPAAGASVTLIQTGDSGVTDTSGEIEFELGRFLKYDIEVKNGSDEVTVPYYVTEGGATRIVVNPQYVKSVEKSLDGGGIDFTDTTTLVPIGILLGVVVFLFILWKFFKRRR